MTPTPDPPADRPTAELQNLLAVYLATAPWQHRPGCDGMLVADALPGYPAAAAAGAVPGEAELCVRHPELTPQIVAFFFLLSVVSDALHPTAGREIEYAGRREVDNLMPPCLT